MTVENEQTDTAEQQKARGDFFEPTTPDVATAVTTAAEAEAAVVAEAEAAKAAAEAEAAKVKDEEPDPTKKAVDPERNEDGTFKAKPAEDKVDDKGEKPAKKILIPKERFDEAGEKAKAREVALHARIAELTKELLADTAGDVTVLGDELDKKGAEYSKLLNEGELDKANIVLKDINRLNRAIARHEATSDSAAVTTAAHAADNFTALVGVYQKEFPSLDDKNEAADQTQIKWVNEKMGLFLQAGMSHTVALKEAVELAAIKFKLGEAPAVETPTDAAKPGDAKAAAEAVRKAAAVKKAADAAQKQPVATGGVGLDSDKAGSGKVAVHQLTQAEFDKLPESVLARARGDYV